MCCIFTCCGWMIDLIQRLWTFAMSCCISSAVCCVLVMSSMSGIAMGYNYSLAEYIDLKETNVSVYLKRGVFDDDIADDIDWRRSGHMPISGHIRDRDLVTALPEEQEMPLRSGRRLDDSVHHSDDHNNFEGSLMRLTARPPAETSTKSPFTRDEKYNEVIEKYPTGSLEQLKELHSLYNMRKAMVRASTINFDKTTTYSVSEDFGLKLENRRMFDGPSTSVVDFRRKEDLPKKLGEEIISRMNPARFAVPNPSDLRAENWYLPNPNVPLEYKKSTLNLNEPDEFFMFSTIVTYPQPIRLKTEYSRPTRSEPYVTPTQTMLMDKFRPRVYDNAQSSDEVNQYKTKLVMDDRRPEINFNALPPARQVEQDYEEEANKGVRKKRNKRNVKSTPPQINSLPSKDTSKTNKHVEKHLGEGLLSRIITISRGVHSNNESEESTFSTTKTEKSYDKINNADSEIKHKENKTQSNSIFETPSDNVSYNAISVTSSILMPKTDHAIVLLSSTKKSSFLKFFLP